MKVHHRNENEFSFKNYTQIRYHLLSLTKQAISVPKKEACLQQMEQL